jgi:hypothetical protein
VDGSDGAVHKSPIAGAAFARRRQSVSMQIDMPNVGAELSRNLVGRSIHVRLVGYSDWALRSMPNVAGIRGSRLVDGFLSPADPYARIRAASIATSARTVVAGWSAAVVQGVPTTFIDGTWGEGEIVPVCLNPRGTHKHRRGIRYSYSGLFDTDVVERHGMQVTSGVRTMFDVIRLARGRTQALQMADACLRFGATTQHELAAYAEARPRWPGIRRVRELIPLLSPFAESPMESALRMVWLDTGLPAPLVNPSIYGPDGSFIARVDLLEPSTGMVGEYNGEWHLFGAQPAHDGLRQRRLEAVGLTVVNVGSPDMTQGGSGAASRLVDTHMRLVAAGDWTKRRPRIVPARR